MISLFENFMKDVNKALQVPSECECITKKMGSDASSYIKKIKDGAVYCSGNYEWNERDLDVLSSSEITRIVQRNVNSGPLTICKTRAELSGWNLENTAGDVNVKAPKLQTRKCIIRAAGSVVFGGPSKSTPTIETRFYDSTITSGAGKAVINLGCLHEMDATEVNALKLVVHSTGDSPLENIFNGPKYNTWIKNKEGHTVYRLLSLTDEARTEIDKRDIWGLTGIHDNCTLNVPEIVVYLKNDNCIHFVHEQPVVTGSTRNKYIALPSGWFLY